MLIRAEGLAKVYDGPPRVSALGGVDFEIAAGEHVAVVGPSGCGKSTLLNLLGMLDLPTAGTLRFDGCDISTLDERQRTKSRAKTIGFVFQQFHLLPDRTSVDNVALPLLYRGICARERRKRAEDALDQVSMAHRALSTPRALSGGEQQRVAIARAIVTRPKILLADEPTGNLDTRTGRLILDTFGQLHDVGHTLVVVTHDAATAERASRTLRLSDGMLIEDATAGRF